MKWFHVIEREPFAGNPAVRAVVSLLPRFCGAKGLGMRERIGFGNKALRRKPWNANHQIALSTVFAFAATGVASGSDSAGDTATDKPMNVVLFLVDDLGWTDIACFGSQLHQTPNIDRLAADGVRFTNAYSPAC